MASEQRLESEEENEMSSEAVETPLKLMELNDTKAGMEGLDVEKINKVIQEASQGSKYYIHKQKNQERLDKRVEQMKARMKSLTQDQIERAERKMDQIADEIEGRRDMSRTLVHIDMDAFYAAVEMRDKPHLRDVPMAVGSNAMLSTSNYLARKFGVRAAMPGFIARKLCPKLVIVPSDMKKYFSVSKEIRAVFAEYDPNFCPMSLDEAYLDITDYLKRSSEVRGMKVDRNMVEEVVNEIRSRIKEKTQLTASAGISCNTRLAKVCSDQNKPDGQFYLCPNRDVILNFVRSLPIRKVNGIGNTTQQLLNAVGVQTCQDLWEKRGVLNLLFLETSWRFFLKVALGLGGNDLTAYNDSERKSIGCERTFADTSDHSELTAICYDLCAEVEGDLKSRGLQSRAMTLKIKTDRFDVRTKIRNLAAHTDDKETIFAAAKMILESEMEAAEFKPLTLRLMGVRMTSLNNYGEMDSSGVGKKQMTINAMLASKTSNVTNTFSCPVCQQTIVMDSEENASAHVDECLNRKAIQEMLEKEENQNKRKTGSSENSRVKKLKKSIGISKPIETYFSK